LSIGFNSENDKIVITCVKAIWFFTFKHGVFKPKKGEGFKKEPLTTMCHCYVGPFLFTGFFDGKIGIWRDHYMLKSLPGHKGRVNGMHSIKDSNKIVSGGQDGKVILWKIEEHGNLIKKKTFDLASPEIRSMNPRVISVCRKLGKNEKESATILVGSRGGEIVEFNEKTSHATVHQRGHYDIELRGLAVHPYKAEAYTFGQDGLLGVWDLHAHRQHKYAQLETPGNVIQFSNKGEFLIIGMDNGNLIVLDKNL
jgi:echinoderm microtubule-associated protein-like 1/2